jgi:hypothetical protein
MDPQDRPQRARLKLIGLLLLPLLLGAGQARCTYMSGDDDEDDEDDGEAARGAMADPA